MTLVDIAPADQAAVEAMWASYVADSGYDGPLVTAFAFGDSAEMAGELGLLVLHGPRRATAELVQAFAAQGEPLPRAGDRCAVLGGDGRPLAVVRTTDVRVGPLWSVDDRFAWDEGEGDRTRAWWLDAHTRFFSRQCTAMGFTFSDDIGVGIPSRGRQAAPLGDQPDLLQSTRNRSPAGRASAYPALNGSPTQQARVSLRYR